MTSVYRTSGLSEREIWEIGDNYVAPKRKMLIEARAELTVADVEAVGLRVEPDVIPHPLHANIDGWPTEKDEWKMFGHELAERAAVVKRGHSPLVCQARTHHDTLGA